MQISHSTIISRNSKTPCHHITSSHSLSPPLTLPQEPIPLNDLSPELDQKHRLAGPHLPLGDGMRRHARREVRPVADALDDAGDKRRAVELAHLLGHADVLVHQRLVVVDHVLVGRLRVGRLLEPVGLPVEEVQPDVLLDEVQQGDDVERAQLVARDFAVEEEVEELDADGVALEVESRGGVEEASAHVHSFHRYTKNQKYPYLCSSS